MTVIGSASIQILPDTRMFTRGLTRQIAGAGAALGAALGTAGLVKNIVTIGVAFHDTLNTFSSLGPSFAAQIGLVSKKAKDLGNDLSLPATSAADAAGAMLELAKGGLSAAQAMDAAKGTLQLASAAQIDGARAAEIQSNALNQFGLSADQAGHVADLLANTANAASGEVTDMAVALKYVGPVARSFGVSIEDTSTAIGLLANSGIKADQAGTSLRGILASLASPSDRAAGAIKRLGLNAFDSQGHFVGLKPLIEQLATAQGKLSTEQFNSNAAMAFGREPLAALTSLASAGGPAFDKMAQAVTRVGGAADVGAAKSKGLGGAFRGLVSQLETTEINIFDAVSPWLEKELRAISGAVPAFTRGAVAVGSAVKTGITQGAGELADALHFDTLYGALDTARKRVDSFFAGLAAHKPADPFGLTDRASKAPAAFGGNDRNSTGDIGKTVIPIATQVATALQTALSTALAAVDWSGAVQALVRSIGPALGGLVAISGDIFRVIGEAIGKVPWVDLGVAMGRQVPSLLAGLAIGIVNFDFGGLLRGLGDHLFETIVGVVTVAFLPSKLLELVARIPFVGALLKFLLEGLQKIARPLAEGAGRLLLAFGRGLADGFTSVFPTVGGAAARFFTLLGPALVTYARLALGFLRDVPGQVGRLIVTATEAAGRLIGAGVSRIPGVVGRALAGLGGLLVRVASGAFSLFRTAVVAGGRAALASVSGLPAAAGRALGSLGGRLLAVGRGAMSLLASAVRAGGTGVLAFFRALPGQIIGLVSGIGGKLIAIGSAIVGGLVAGITGAAGRVRDAVERVIGGIPGFVKRLLGIHSPSTVMADVAAGIPQGVALGITRNSGLVAKALADLVDPAALGVSAGDLAAAAARASATAIDKALADRDAVVTARGPAATASTTAAAAAAAASAAAAVLQGKSDKAAAALAKLNQQLKDARAAAADAARGGLAHARALEDEAARARDAAQAMPAHTKAQKAARDAALAHADALEQQARAASRSKQATADADAGEVASLVKQRDAASAAAKAAKDAADKAKSAAKDKIAAAKDAADALLKIDQDLAAAQAALADAVAAAQADAAQKARDAAVADGQSMLDIYSSQVDALVARSQALTGAFRDSVLAGAGLGDIFSSVRDGLSKAADDAQSAATSAASAVAAAQDKLTAATSRYNEALAKQQAELAALEEQERQQRQTLAAATLTRVEAERRLAAARAVATDGAAASAFELEDLKGAYAAYIAAQKAEQDAQSGVNDAADKTSEKRAEQLSELNDLAQAQQDLAAAQQAAADSADALAKAQANTGTVVAGVIDGLKNQLASAQAFAEQIGQLAGLGLNDNLLAQIAALGPQAGSALAAGIIAAGPPAITQINTLTDQIGTVANTGLDAVAQSLFGKGADVLAQLIEGIRSRFPELDDAIAQINAKLSQIAAGERAVADAQAAAATQQAAAVKYTGAVGSNLTLKVTDNSTTTVNGSGLSSDELARALQQANAQKNADLLQLLKQGVR